MINTLKPLKSIQDIYYHNNNYIMVIDSIYEIMEELIFKCKYCIILSYYIPYNIATKYLKLY